METLPCPRLELRWIKTGETWSKRECVYSLVLPVDEHDIRQDQDNCANNELTIEIGRTAVTSGPGDEPPIFGGSVDTPFRDGAHSIWDQKALGNHIPRVAVCGDVFTILNEVQ